MAEQGGTDGETVAAAKGYTAWLHAIAYQYPLVLA